MFCLLFKEHSGFIGKLLNPLLCGFFGVSAAVIPFLVLVQAVLWRKSIKTDSVIFKLVSSAFVLVSLSVIIHIIAIPKDDLTFNVATLWEDGNDWLGGGIVGGFISKLFVAGVDKTLTLCIFIPVMAIFSTFIFGLTPFSAIVFIKSKLREGKDKLNSYEIDYEEEKVWHSHKDKRKLKIDESALLPDEQQSPVDLSAYDEALRERQRKKNELDVALTDEPPFNPDVALDELAEDIKSTNKEAISPINKTDKDINLDGIFNSANTEDVPSSAVDGSVPNAKEIELMVERKQLKEDKLEAPIKEPQPVKEYVFPPLSLLNQENNVKNEDEAKTYRIK